MSTSEDKERKKQGFETWSSSKKSKLKNSVTKEKVPNDNAKGTEGSAKDIGVPVRKASSRSPITSSPIEKGLAKKVKSRTKKSEKVIAKGTVNISEKEYRMLLKFKEKSKQMPQGICEEDENPLSPRMDDNVRPQESLAIAVQVDERQKRSAGLGTVSREEMENDMQKRKRGKDKELARPAVLDVHGVSEEEERRTNLKRRKLEYAEADEDLEIDNDFEEPPKSQFRTGHVESSEVNRRRQHVAITTRKKNTALQGALQEDPALAEQEELGISDVGREAAFKNQEKLYESRPRKKKFAETMKTTFAFENREEEEGLQLVRQEGSAELVCLGDDDDDFQKIPRHDRAKKDLLEMPVLTEAEARARRKRKKSDRDIAIRRRESAGEKPYYIMVNSIGIPYGDGLSAWRAEVNKLARGLDPSIRDIRQQPHHKILILKKRLMEKFNYSAVISDKFLLPLVGQRVSARRNELMNAIRAGKRCPSGMDEDLWNRLEDIYKSANFQKKSAAMRYANACRHNLGRTGPGGEVGVRDSLKDVLRRSPDPDEVQAEMTRDKGYQGKKKKTKKMAIRVKVGKDNEDSGEEGIRTETGEEKDYVVNELQGTTVNIGQSSHAEGGKESLAEQMELMKKLLVQFEELKAKVEAGVTQPAAANVGTAVHSMTVTPPTSSCRGVTEQADVASETPTSLLPSMSTLSNKNNGK